MNRLITIIALWGLTIARKFDYDCNEEYQHLTVGHLNLTDDNYSKFKKDIMATTKVFVMGVSDSSCVQCCFTEALLDNLKSSFDSKQYTAKVSSESCILL